MVTDALVRDQIDAGKLFLDLLRRHDFPVDAAYWLRNPDDETWKLVIATERAVRDYRDAYLDIALWMSEDEVLDHQNGLEEFRLQDVSLVSPSNSVAVKVSRFARDVTRSISHLNGTLDGQYIGEAIVYKLPG